MFDCPFIISLYVILYVISQAQTTVFCAGVLDSLAIELRRSKDFSKLCAGIAILGYIASILEPINIRAFSQLLSFLDHRYPKVCNAVAICLLYSPKIFSE